MPSDGARNDLGVAVPAAGPGVCATCHGPARDGWPDCWCCRVVSARLGPGATRPIVVALRVCRNGDALHAVLRGYKDDAAAPARHHFAGHVHGLLAEFSAIHAGRVERAAGPWDTVVTVPSSGRGSAGRRQRRGRRHPLEPIAEAVFATHDVRHLDRAPGVAPPRHLVPQPRAFHPVDDVAGRRVLLIDDTWVTGARVRSAACSVERAGAEVVAMLVVARIVDTAAAPGNARWWSWAESQAEHRAAAGPPCCARCRSAAPRVARARR